MNIQINNSSDPLAHYVTWAPSPCIIHATAGQKIIIKNKYTDKGGQLVFMATVDEPLSELAITIPENGSADIFIAGKFGYPSSEDKDAVIQVKDAADTQVLDEIALMVRIRKNAEHLTEAERDRFLSALARFKASNEFNNLIGLHNDKANYEIHGRKCFLPWHRAYLLDLERKLQQFDPAVTFPYWKFHQAAPFTFTEDFMGKSDKKGIVQFSKSNPLSAKQSAPEYSNFIKRVHKVYNREWDPRLQGANAVLKNELQTLLLGPDFSSFSKIEIDPHNNVHGSFNGQMSNPNSAPQDPLFFLLHANIDRIWAKWQWLNKLLDPADASAYTNQGTYTVNGNNILDRGNFSGDTMWPWNGFNSPFDPPTGYNFPCSAVRSYPGISPTVGQMIDYQGKVALNNNLCFSYDDVPFYN